MDKLKVLWVVNIEMPGHRDEKGSIVASGSWLGACLEALVDAKDLEVHIVATASVDSVYRRCDGNTFYYLLPGGSAAHYNVKSDSSRTEWRQLVGEIAPDVIHIWGTEYPQAELVSELFPQIPKIIYLQGVMQAISQTARRQVVEEPWQYKFAIGSLIKHILGKRPLVRYVEAAKRELNVIRSCGHIFYENEWSARIYRACIQDLEYSQTFLPIRDVFSSTQWEKLGRSVPFTITTNALNGPLKGASDLIEILRLCKRSNLPVKVNIPGLDLRQVPLVKRVAYQRYFLSCLKKYELEGYINFLGMVSAEQLKDVMLQSDVFLLVSMVENHSASLIEAMTLGMPVVSTNVGGVPELITHGQNGYIYRYGEAEIAFSYLDDIAQERIDVRELGVKARKTALANRSISDISTQLIHGYKKAIGNKQ